MYVKFVVSPKPIWNCHEKYYCEKNVHFGLSGFRLHCNEKSLKPIWVSLLYTKLSANSQQQNFVVPETKVTWLHQCWQANCSWNITLLLCSLHNWDISSKQWKWKFMLIYIDFWCCALQIAHCLATEACKCKCTVFPKSLRIRGVPRPIPHLRTERRRKFTYFLRGSCLRVRGQKVFWQLP